MRRDEFFCDQAGRKRRDPNEPTHVRIPKSDKGEPHRTQNECFKGFTQNECLKGFTQNECLKGFTQNECFKGYTQNERFRGYTQNVLRVTLRTNV